MGVAGGFRSPESFYGDSIPMPPPGHPDHPVGAEVQPFANQNGGIDDTLGVGGNLRGILMLLQKKSSQSWVNSQANVRSSPPESPDFGGLSFSGEALRSACARSTEGLYVRPSCQPFGAILCGGLRQLALRRKCPAAAGGSGLTQVEKMLGRPKRQLEAMSFMFLVIKRSLEVLTSDYTESCR